MTTIPPIARLLHNLGYLPDDIISINVIAAGEHWMRSSLTPVHGVSGVVAAVQEGADCYFGAFPLRADVPEGKRGCEADAVAIRALTVDLDDEKLDLQAQDAVIARLTDELGARPAVVATGGGRHVHWRVARTSWAHWDSPDDPAFNRVRVFYRRWSDYAVRLGAEYGGSIDGLKDMSRIWRVPGTSNHKRGAPRPVGLRGLGSGRVRLSDLERLLDAQDVEQPVMVDFNRSAATSAVVQQYMASNTECRRYDRDGFFLSGIRKQWPREYAKTGSCHQSAVALYAEAVRQVRAGYCDAATADSLLYELFRAALDEDGKLTPRRFGGLDAEWAGIQSWGVSNGSVKDPEDICREIERRRIRRKLGIQK